MFANTPAEEKLAILRSESKRILSTAHGYSLIMHKLIEERRPLELPDDFEVWCKKVADSVEEVQDLIDALTDQEHRSVFRDEQAKRDREFGEMLWKGHQQGLPELQSYACLRDAVEQTAHRLGLSLFASEAKIDDSFWHPGGMVYFYAPERRAHIGAQASQRDSRRYLGYAIILEWLSDKRNVKWGRHEGLAPSLDEAVTVLHHWLIGKQELQIIQREFQWMSNGIIQRDA